MKKQGGPFNASQGDGCMNSFILFLVLVFYITGNAEGRLVSAVEIFLCIMDTPSWCCTTL